MRKLLYFLSAIFLITPAYVETGRVPGGQPAKKEQFPFFVQLRVAKFFDSVGAPVYYQSGGTLIHPKWILCTAHSFYINDTRQQIPPVMFERNLTHAMMGSEKRAQIIGDPNFVIRFLEKVVIHPNFNPTQNHDIAVAQLKEPFKLNKYIKTVTLPSEKSVICSRGIVVGTGMVDNKLSFSNTVEYTYVNLTDTKPKGTLLYSNTIYLHGHPYRGDSGGPFLCSRIQHAVIFGYYPPKPMVGKIITSVFESVDVHMGFIKKHVPLRSFYGLRLERTKKKHNEKSENPQETSRSTGRKNSAILTIIIVVCVII